ncbi:MAG TPA: glycoside hydrolase family 2 TIM barrel-domain containing protein [Draconibacterium sp.]|nr:glycoside hydrolase family 2 TIM barrel-domain containing protein [Draconibacterium sp.]
MKTNLLHVVYFTIIFIQTSCTFQNESFEREASFNSNWKFIRADVAGAEQTAFDDLEWRSLDLPHDYSIEDLPESTVAKQIGPFSEESAGGASTAHVTGGTAWYRKHFTLHKKDKGKIVKIIFDGIYMNSDVWINGNHLGNHPYGYTAFAYDLTQYLNPSGQDNVLAVQVKNEGKNSRWYSGSGIYRDVALFKLNPVHIDLWGNYISTAEVSAEKAVVDVSTEIVNSFTEKETGNIRVEIKNPAGSVVSILETQLEVDAGQKKSLQQNVEIGNPELWSSENPALYTAEISWVSKGKVMDHTSERFGIRTYEFSAEKGFLLNGESVLLKGGCMHHDNGVLGSATFKTAEFRRVQTMKENGFNAIRTAHNPPSKVFLDACDQLGLLVMNESFDQWQKPKNPKDYNLYFYNWWEKDIESMVKRDRNHPSIIIWSVGNEIKERADSSGLEIFKKLRNKILEFDNSRPVTQAICSFWDNPGLTWNDTEAAFALMDVQSYNYQWKQYEPDHEKFPGRIMIGTESIAMEAFENWQQVEKHSYVIGDFVWTGMDHLGESGIGNAKLDNDTTKFLPPWPWFVNYSGDISIMGNKKPQMYFRDVVWRNSNLEMLVHAPIPAGRKEVVSFWGWPNEFKSWNWEGYDGTPLQVSVYSRCSQVRLELNGTVIGTKDISEETKLTAKFDVPYQPGELVAVGLKGGKEVTRQTLKTTGKPAQLKITAEKQSIAATDDDLAYFNVEVLDENGMLVTNAEIPVEFEISGPCKLQAVANENPKDMHSFQQTVVNSFRGKCQLIVRLIEEGGDILVSANSDGLNDGIATVKVTGI